MSCGVDGLQHLAPWWCVPGDRAAWLQRRLGNHSDLVDEDVLEPPTTDIKVHRARTVLGIQLHPGVGCLGHYGLLVSTMR